MLVVLVIIAILVALLLPAVQAAREAARQMTCQSNIRQVAIALQNHHAALGRFPTGWVETEQDGRPGWAWGALLLPYLEQPTSPNVEWAGGARYGQGGPGGGGSGGGGGTPGPGGLNIDHSSNQELRERVIPILLCPSDPAPKRFMLHQGNGGGSGGPPMFEVARANYTGVFGTQPIGRPPLAGDGMFCGNLAIRLGDVTDGTSNTLLLGERATEGGTAPWMGSATWVGAVPGAYQHTARVVGQADRVPNDVLGGFSDFASYHLSGTHFAMVDGSVRKISDEIEQAVFRALATRAAGD